MSKRNITYIKPEEPNFLKELKQQIGYKEGPTVDTKREELDSDFVDNVDIPDEQPTVVVLQPGDLTAEEAEQAKAQLEKEEAEKPANLSERVIFRKPTLNSLKRENTPDSSSVTVKEKKSKTSATSKDSKKKKNTKPTLSFNDEDEEEV